MAPLQENFKNKGLPLGWPLREKLSSLALQISSLDGSDEL